MSQDLLNTIQSMMGTKKRRSIMSPVHMFCAICFGTACYIIRYSDNINFKIIACILMLVATLFFIISYILFAIYDRDRLHTEDYLIEQKKMEWIQRKGEAPQLSSSDISVLPPQQLVDGGNGE
jgi:hypothetical protein